MIVTIGLTSRQVRLQPRSPGETAGATGSDRAQKIVWHAIVEAYFSWIINALVYHTAQFKKQIERVLLLVGLCGMRFFKSGGGDERF